MITSLCRKSVRYIGVLLLSGTLIFCGLSSPVSAANVTRLKANGNFAHLLVFSDVTVFISLNQVGTVNNPQTYLSYFINDATGTTIASGNGYIPNGDLTGQLQTGLSLRTDTSRINGDVYGTGGAIEIDWNKVVGGFSNLVAGTQQSRNGNLFTVTSGNWYYSNTSATGTILSYPIGASNFFLAADVGTNNQVTITIEKEQ